MKLSMKYKLAFLGLTPILALASIGYGTTSFQATWGREVHKSQPSPGGLVWLDNQDTGVTLRVQSDLGTALESLGTAVFDGGKVGIGTNNPAHDLHVEGIVQIDDGTQGDGKVLTSDASGVARWEAVPTPLVDLIYFQFYGREDGYFTVNHDLGRVPSFIEGELVEHHSTGEAGGNWSTGWWQSNAAGSAQRTTTHHGDKTISYNDPLLHVAANPIPDYRQNTYVRVYVSSVTDRQITLRREKRYNGFDDRLLRVVLRVQ